MRIAINIGSSLLGRALQSQLMNEPEISDVQLVNECFNYDRFVPDFVIIDPHTVWHKMPEIMVQAKNVLLDYGLSEEAISSLLIYNKIDGIIAPDMDIAVLLRAFKAIDNGQIWIENSKIKALVNYAESSKDAIETVVLTTKEREVVKLVADGLSNKQIAFNLCVSEQTVKTHLNSIFKKTNLERRTQLVPLGMKLNRSQLI